MGRDFMQTRTLSSLKLFGIIIFSILYLEIFFETRVLNFEFDITFFRMILFSFSYTVLIMFFVMFFKEKTVKKMMYVLIFVITFLYVNQEIYHSFVEGFYSIAVAGDFTAGLSFIGDYITAFRFIHIFYLVPILSLYFLSKYKLIDFYVEYCTLKRPLVLLITGTAFFFIGLQTIDENIEDSGAMVTYSDMDLYTYMYNSQDALKKFGLLTFTQRDFFSLFRSDPLSESEYEILIDDYFASQPNHIINNFSGIFSDKNLILIMAESLDTFAINEVLTPNLYALKTENAYFENYYSPLYYRSTADTEFLSQTSMYPNKNVALSMDAYTDNTFLYTLPKLFESRGYETLSFHNYIDYFYPRSDFHTEALGYNSYYGPEEMGMDVNNSNNNLIFNHDWQSDYDMMVAAVPEFINQEKFFVNMLTVSGHFKYSSDHPIASQNAQAVTDYEIATGIDLDSQIFYYLAANIELDKAIGYLFDELEAAGKKEDTVVIIYGDHYAYGVDKSVIWEYDEMKDPGSDMDIHNVPLMIYSDSFILDGLMDYYMSSIDIIPTISNLFNLPLDYGKVFGNDALANDDNVVRFADLSFVSRTFSYDSLSEEMNISGDVNPEYIVYLSNKFINDYKYNVLVLDFDYFRKDEDDEDDEEDVEE
jgi:phosphoglycerol transferase MdoB-like AlkP superfamily enzyme